MNLRETALRLTLAAGLTGGCAPSVQEAALKIVSNQDNASPIATIMANEPEAMATLQASWINPNGNTPAAVETATPAAEAAETLTPYPFSLTMHEHDEVKNGKVVGTGQTYSLNSEQVAQMITEGTAQVRSYARVELPDAFKSHASLIKWTADGQPDAQTSAVSLQMDRWRYGDDRANVTFSMGLTDRGGSQNMQEVSPFQGCDVEPHPLNDGVTFVNVELDSDGNPYSFSLTMHEHDEVKNGKVVGTGQTYSLNSEQVAQMITEGTAQVRSYARVELPDAFKSHASLIKWTADGQPDAQTSAVSLQMDRWRYGDDRANVTFSMGLTDRGGSQNMQEVSPFQGCDVEPHPLNDGVTFVNVELQ